MSPIRMSALSTFQFKPLASVCFAVGLMFGGALVSAVQASETVYASLNVQAEISARTSLSVSTETLQFEVANPSAPATASVDFWAAARTQPGAEVVLLVESLPDVEGNVSSGANQIELGGLGPTEGAGGRNASIKGNTVTVRWRESGRQRGTLRFMLRARTPGTYTVPLRFVLTAP